MIVDGRRDRLHQENLLAGHRFQQLHRHLTVWEAVNAAIAEVRSQLAHHRCGQSRVRAAGKHRKSAPFADYVGVCRTHFTSGCHTCKSLRTFLIPLGCAGLNYDWPG
jgi:hypothetical protein